MQLGGGAISLSAFVDAVHGASTLNVSPELRARLNAARDIVDAASSGDAPVYGLNTGLGANLGHRINPQDIAAFQYQLIAGRAVATGEPLPELTGRALLLARLISASTGHSGISLRLFDHLVAVFASGLSPVVPRYGSIGAGDLTQNATWALALLGQGQMWRDGKTEDAGAVLAALGIDIPELLPKDGMALINHGGLTTALAADALHSARRALRMARCSALLSCVGYGANGEIFDPEINELRDSPGQTEVASWFARHLAFGEIAPRRVQDALSFRVLAPVLGAAQDTLDRAIMIWEAEANGASDSPVVLGNQAMRSTPNFHAPALALALEGLALALSMMANGAVQRVQRMMNPDLTGLPRYLSPVGGASAGMVPLQKTAAALSGEIRRHALPVTFDPAPVSETVEDMAPMTPAAALKLSAQADVFQQLCGIEALVAAQAMDLQTIEVLPSLVMQLHTALRAKIPMLQEDRALGPDIEKAAQVLSAVAEDT